MRDKLTLEEIKKRLKIKKPYIEILSIEIKPYGNQNRNAVYCNCKCLNNNCGYIWNSLWSNLYGKRGCPACSRQVVTDINSIRAIRPDLIKYLKNESDSDKYSYGSTKQIKCVCPDCGTERMIKINDLSNTGFSCKICSDGISIPEKFGIGLFKQLYIKFEVQKSFEGLSKKRYDFYMMELNTIIEIHGYQHYKDGTWGSGRNLIEEQSNDKLKKELALKNGIKYYIEIDCRKSEFEWLKENYIKELSEYFDLSQIDWLKIWEECQNSLKVKVWEAWNNRGENETSETLSKIFMVSRPTITKYLRDGTILGKCKYDPKYESFLSGKKRHI